MWRRMISVAALALAAVLPAAAQQEPQAQNWAFRLGVWYPSSSSVRNATTNFWVYFGAERYLPTIGTVSLDYSEGSDTNNKVRMFSLFVNSRQNYAPKLDLLAGLGIVNAKVTAAGVDRTRTRLGGTVGVAYALTPRVELQVRYQVGGFKEVNGFVATVNFRF
ncbi:MAG: hypothetical protein LKKZDAJK_000923 [Candidatus Fervidibacter sp.]|jgi:opacity protein-like surface antigen